MTGGSQPRVAVVGATGAVGNQLVELLETRAFPKQELVLFASACGASNTVEIDDHEFDIQEFDDPGQLRGFDLAFLAVPEACAQLVTEVRPGPLLIDLSSACRAPSSRPLLAPGITPRERIHELRGLSVFEVPHPAAHALAIILRSVGLDYGFVSAVLMAGASAGGRDRVAEAAQQSADLLSGSLNLGEDEAQLGLNILVSERERGIAEAVRAQVGLLLPRAPTIAVQAVAVPILHGCALAVNVPPSIDSSDWASRLRPAPGVLLVEDSKSLGVADVLGQEAIIVRIDRHAAGTSLLSVFDNARLAALIAIWVAENLLFTSH